MWKQLSLSILLCLAVTPAIAADAASNWPGFRGPEFTGVAPAAKPPITWSESENIKWKVELPGRGSGSPIVWGERIYLQTAIKTDRTAESQPGTAATESTSTFQLTATNGTRLLAQAETPPVAEPVPPAGSENREGRGEGRRGRRGGGGFGGGGVPTNVHQFVVMCIDRNTGETIWQEIATEAIPHEGHHGTASFASSTPVSDGKNLYVSFGSRGIYSYDINGKLRRKKDLGIMRTRNMFGEGLTRRRPSESERLDVRLYRSPRAADDPDAVRDPADLLRHRAVRSGRPCGAGAFRSCRATAPRRRRGSRTAASGFGGRPADGAGRRATPGSARIRRAGPRPGVHQGAGKAVRLRQAGRRSASEMLGDIASISAAAIPATSPVLQLIKEKLPVLSRSGLWMTLSHLHPAGHPQGGERRISLRHLASSGVSSSAMRFPGSCSRSCCIVLFAGGHRFGVLSAARAPRTTSRELQCFAQIADYPAHHPAGHCRWRS